MLEANCSLIVRGVNHRELPLDIRINLIYFNHLVLMSFLLQSFLKSKI